ncbi:MAG: ISL3 family transposase [Actinomycetota bacterium]|nr:ISL3 family transposase [Actinomycetota bacterium]
MEAAILGLGGFVVLAVDEMGGELEVSVETTATRVGCPDCGVVASLHGRRTVLVRDLAGFDRRVRLRWRKRVWCCREAACGRCTWTERHPGIAPRAALSQRARRAAAKRVGKDAEPVAAVARDLGVGWHTVMRAVIDHGRPLVDDPARLEAVAALGVDETAFLRATRARSTRYVSGLVDIADGRLLDVVEDRTAKSVAQWLSARPPRWLRRIGVVALDPYRGYANAMLAHVGHATVVVDHWHVIRLGNRAVDDVRRRVQHATLGHRGRKSDPLYRARKLLLRAADGLDAAGWWRLSAALRQGDADGQVAAAWQAKELLRDVYLRCDADHGRRALDAFYDWVDTHPIPELRRLAGTVRRWEREILAWHTTDGASNGVTEAVNLAIKNIKRAGRGFRNFDNYRLRLLLHCGGVNWQDQPAARLRARSPRLVA